MLWHICRVIAYGVVAMAIVAGFIAVPWLVCGIVVLVSAVIVVVDVVDRVVDAGQRGPLP